MIISINISATQFGKSRTHQRFHQSRRLDFLVHCHLLIMILGGDSAENDDDLCIC